MKNLIKLEEAAMMGLSMYLFSLLPFAWWRSGSAIRTSLQLVKTSPTSLLHKGSEAGQHKSDLWQNQK